MTAAADGRVALLGAGIMGAAMARNLLGRRPAGDGVGSVGGGCRGTGGSRRAAADSPPDAVRDAQVVITMLPDAAVVDEVIFDGGAAAALAPHAVWAQMGTIGTQGTVRAADRLRQLRPDVYYVDAPVSGSKGPAESGTLLILASGPAEAAPVVRPAFEAIGRKTVWLGEAGQGSKMKLAVNAYMSVLIEGVAEALTLADRLGIDPAKLEEAIAGGPLDAPIADAKLHKMEGRRLRARVPAAVGAQGRRPGRAGGRRRVPAAARGALPAVARRRRRRSRPRRRQCRPAGARRPGVTCSGTTSP